MEANCKNLVTYSQKFRNSIMKPEEFKNIISPLKNKMFRFARRLLGNTEDAADTLQDVMIKVWQAADRLNSGRNVESFIMASVKNLCIDRLRLKKQNFVEFDDEFTPSPENSQLNSMIQDETLNIVHNIINHLPEKQKIAVHLRDIEGMEYEQIADITGLNMANVKVTVSRARKKIREELIRSYKYEKP